MKIIKSKIFLFKLCLLIFMNLYSSVYAEKRIKLYFSNDSINGLKPSDAYETHNMGIKYYFNNNFIEIDLGLVGPDMFIYENKYREANRSFGELVRITYGKKKYEDLNTIVYLNYIAQGKFGLDKLQNFAHSIANFQIETDILEKVRMPDNQWIGAGINYRGEQYSFKNLNYSLILNGYVGSDKTTFSFGFDNILFERLNSSAKIISNFQYVPYDKIVSADPVKAPHRKLIPSLKIQYTYNYRDMNLTIYEKISLPTINSDNRPYLLFGASLELPFNF